MLCIAQRTLTHPSVLVLEVQGRPSVGARVGWEGVVAGQERAATPIRVPAQTFIVTDKHKRL